MIDPQDIVTTLKNDGASVIDYPLEDDDEGYTHIIEACKGYRELTIYFGENDLFVMRIWGPNKRASQMSEHECTPMGLSAHLSWLIKEEI